MAWYSLYKWFAPWRKKSYVNWAYWYGEYVCKTPEQREEERIERERRGREALASLGMLFNTVDNATHGGVSRNLQIMRDIDKIMFNSQSKYW